MINVANTWWTSGGRRCWRLACSQSLLVARTCSCQRDEAGQVARRHSTIDSGRPGMGQKVLSRCWRLFSPWSVTVAIVTLAGLVGWPTAGNTQTVTGYARAVRATVLGTTTALSDTGTLAGSDDARQASQVAVVPAVLSAESLHATAIGWPDQAAAEASLA